MKLSQLNKGERFVLCRTGGKYEVVGEVTGHRDVKVQPIQPKGAVTIMHSQSKVEKYEKENKSN